MRLSGKKILVTGASRGIGRALAKELVLNGAVVYANYKDETESLAAATLRTELPEALQMQLHYIAADLRDANQVIHLFDTIGQLGGLEVLVNNAGECTFIDLDKIDTAQWTDIFNLNLHAVFACSKAAVRLMRTNGVKGSIITIGSIGAFFGSSHQAHYNASKAAVCSLSRSIAVRYAGDGIRSNSILPGCILTDINRSVLLSDDTKRKELEMRTPLGRLGAVEDIVGAAVFLASDESAFCTGSEIVVDGGISINV